MADEDPESRLPLPTTAFQILVSLADGDRHGYSIMQEVEERTGGKVKLHAGTLYASIKRLLESGWIQETTARHGPAHDDQRRRYYRLTGAGRRVAQAELHRLEEMVKQARASGLSPARR